MASALFSTYFYLRPHSFTLFYNKYEQERLSHQNDMSHDPWQPRGRLNARKMIPDKF